MKAMPAGHTHVVLPDIHGNYAGFLELLYACGAIDASGRRRPGFAIAQLGDLIHGGHEVTEADRVTLELGRELIDVCLLGNHELPFVTSIEPALFAGVHARNGVAAHPSCQTELNAAMREGFFQAAVAIDGWLLTHAGLSPAHLVDADGKVLDEWREAISSPEALAELLEERFVRRLQSHERDAVIDAISGWRGGESRHGSILWADVQEVVFAAEELGNPVPQIVGHTPRMALRPHVFELPAGLPLGHEPIWALDMAGIDDGSMAALINEEPGQDAWREVIIDRPVRPLRAGASVSTEDARAQAMDDILSRRG
jgi:hypothetical protein